MSMQRIAPASPCGPDADGQQSRAVRTWLEAGANREASPELMLVDKILFQLRAGRQPSAVDINWLDENILTLVQRVARRAAAGQDRQKVRMRVVDKNNRLLQEQNRLAVRAFTGAHAELVAAKRGRDELSVTLGMMEEKLGMTSGLLLQAQAHAEQLQSACEKLTTELEETRVAEMDQAAALNSVRRAMEQGNAERVRLRRVACSCMVFSISLLIMVFA